jgi:hypothetical protein
MANDCYRSCILADRSVYGRGLSIASLGDCGFVAVAIYKIALSQISSKSRTSKTWNEAISKMILSLDTRSRARIDRLS